MSTVMRFWVLSVAVLLGASLIVDCYGQPPGGGGGRGGFGGGRGGMGRGGFGRGGGVAGLLGMEEVKKELKVTDEQAQEVEKLREEGRQDVDFSNWGEMSEEDREKAMKTVQAATEKVDAELPTILDPEQFKRLLGLYAQRSGPDALTNKLVSKEIGLSDETVQKVKAKQDELNPFRRGRGQGGGGGGGGPGGFGGAGGGGPGSPDFAERMEKMRKEREDALFGEITPEEKEKFEALKGEKFEFPAWGGGGGRGGRGGRGGNDNSNN